MADITTITPKTKRTDYRYSSEYQSARSRKSWANYDRDSVFWNKVDKTGECWIWTGHKNAHGYGKFKYLNKSWFAHRLAYVLTKGQIPDGAHLLHKCDNPSCVNPDHLTPGSHTDNMRDMEVKGRSRHPTGEEHGRAKLTIEQVLAIRSTAGKQRDIAKQYGVTKSTVGRIKRGEHWRNVP